MFGHFGKSTNQGTDQTDETDDTDDTADEVHETKNVGEACAASVTFQFNEPCPGTACCLSWDIYVYIYTLCLFNIAMETHHF